ncbi:MAG: hypothetical protein M0R50_11160 [Candidatus Cloacimonetes bacterium]|jgi:hypothetical protein|nr:hypothetical protein [Candidatus Cloacimonadota bacterium]
MVITNNTNQINVLQCEEADQYKLVTFVVALPSQTYDKTAETQGRPFEFIFDMPSKFSVMCPFCCAGLYVGGADIIEKYGYKFISCSECGTGKPVVAPPLPVLLDPFVNPFNSKQLNRCELDEIVTSINSVPESDSLTVAQKMSRAT